MFPSQLQKFAKNNAARMCVGRPCTYLGTTINNSFIKGRLVGYCASTPVFLLLSDNTVEIKIIPCSRKDKHHIMLTDLHLFEPDCHYVSALDDFSVLEANKKELAAIIKALEL